MNCKACEHYAPLVKEPHFIDYESFKKALYQLKTLISDIGMIRIMGGEPLLNKKLKNYILLSRELYPKSAIAVVTNALLIKQMDDELFYLMKQLRVYFLISLYPPMEEKINDIEKFLDEKGVAYWTSPLMKEFTVKQILTGENDKEKAFSGCLQAHYHNLYEGKIAACFLPFGTPYFNESFDQKIPCDGIIDLYQEGLTTNKLKEALITPFNRCRFCSDGVNTKWEQAHNPAEITEWIKRITSRTEQRHKKLQLFLRDSIKRGNSEKHEKTDLISYSRAFLRTGICSYAGIAVSISVLLLF